MSSTENNNRAASHDFQTALRLLEERLRSLEDSEDIINGLLQGAAEFYGAARASVVEADWDLKIGLLTYEWCAEGVEHQKDMLQYLAVEGFPRWCDFLSLNRPVVIPDMEAIKDTYPDEYQFFQRYGVQSILAAPFSKRINQGYIAVDDPTRFQDDPTFLFIISYAVVVELNEIKLSQSIAVAQRASKYSDRDVYVNCLGDLEIRNAKGTLTEEDISSDLCLNLFALIITNAKCPLKANRLAEELWPEDVIDNPYRTVSNITYRLRRILSMDISRWSTRTTALTPRHTGPHRVAPTMSARYGTGGNNVPLVEQDAPVYCIVGNAIDRQPQNGGNGCGYQENVAYTLTATDHHAIAELYQETVGALCRGDEKGAGNQYVSQNKCIVNPSTAQAGLLIRRLTPLECERLQGFPDGWTNIPGTSDSARYKALGNSVAIPCVEYVMRGIALVLRSGAGCREEKG